MPTSKPLADLITYLYGRREAILNNLRTVCEDDPELTSVSVLTREEFNNLLPIILDILEQQLSGRPEEADPKLTATSHGLHRWQKAHGLTGLLRELTHLSQILTAELRLFRQLYPTVDADFMLQVNQHITQLMNQVMIDSATKYDELQRLEAASRAADLEQTLNQMNELLRQRGEILRTSSHDLRSGLGIAQSAAYLLNIETLGETERTQYLEMLNRNLMNVQTLLNKLMDLSRLDAGQELLHVQGFDVAVLLNDLVANAQPLATERNIMLRADGTSSLIVENDKEKVYRVAQNLLLNALSYAPSGTMVSVSWSRENDFRWVFSIQDAGPGLPNNLMSLFAKQLSPTVEPTAVLGPDQGQPVDVLPTKGREVPPGPELAKQAAGSHQGEGVGLQIVKRLCELMDATLEVETRSGRGTLFRIRLVIRQSAVL